MASLGELLVLLHDASVRARPATLTVVDWRHASRSEEAFRRFMAQRSATPVPGAAGRGAGKEESSWSTRLAFESPTRFREEAAGVQAGTRFLVRDGERWASWDEDWGAVTSESADDEGPRSSSYGLLLDPSPLAAVLRFDPVGATEVAGRPAVRATATPRPDDGTGLAALLRVGAAGADTIELAVDAERGALLRAEATIDGDPFHRLEVTAIEYGPLPAGALDLSLPDGVEATAGWFRPLRLELHELPAAAPFPVFVPGVLPDGWRLHESLLVPAHEHPPVEGSVSLVYGSRDGGYAVTIRERAAGAEPEEWLVWTPDDGLERADAGEYVEPRHHVRLERDGTLVELAGQDADLLGRLARGLVPAPTAPPRLPNE